MLAQPRDEASQRGDAAVEALDILDPPRSLDLIDYLDFLQVGLDSPVRHQVPEQFSR
jgi:hypothetical protein